MPRWARQRWRMGWNRPALNRDEAGYENNCSTNVALPVPPGRHVFRFRVHVYDAGIELVDAAAHLIFTPFNGMGNQPSGGWIL